MFENYYTKFALGVNAMCSVDMYNKFDNNNCIVQNIVVQSNAIKMHFRYCIINSIRSNVIYFLTYLLTHFLVFVLH